MTWKSFHNRGEVLRNVIACADQRRDGILPMDIEGVAETFADELTLLAALELKWHTRLAGRIEQAQMNQPLDLELAVVAAWQETAELLPGVRLILDHYRANPSDNAMAQALAKATTKERVLLAMMAGAASAADAGAAAAGARIEERARAERVEMPVDEVFSTERVPFLERLRTVLAA